MIVWSRPSCAPPATPFCAVHGTDASVHTFCGGRWAATEPREDRDGAPAPGDRCRRCWSLSGGALADLALLPCPFCGGEPRRGSRVSDHTETGEFYTVACFCGGCSAKAWQQGDTAEQAAERWNTRCDVHRDLKPANVPQPDSIASAFDHLQEDAAP